MSGIMRAPDPGDATRSMSIPYSGTLADNDMLVLTFSAGIPEIGAYYESGAWKTTSYVRELVDSNNVLTFIANGSDFEKAAFIPGPNH